MSKTILLDPGHGGHDSGAVADHGGYRYVEKDIVLKIAYKLRRMLIDDGQSVNLTRSNDTFVELAHRRALQAGHTVFVSIHCNSADNGQAAGYETWVGVGATKSKKFAGYVQGALIRCVSSYKKKLKISGYVVRNRGVKSKDFAVIRKPLCPAILVECGFISNDIESALMGNDDFIWTLAFAIKQGVLKYLAEVQG